MNPFDFANPVTNPDLFAGRSRELAELDYYVSLAAAQKAIGLALVGERTSGKTSLLNMASGIAQRRGFLVARLDLTGADVTSEEAFLRSFYEALFLAARKKQLWETKTEDVYDSFRQAMDGSDPNSLREFCDVVFPRTYAVSNATGRAVSNFPVALLIQDLRTILESKLIPTCDGIALLIDEAEHLSLLPTVLEKLRHLMTVADHFVVIVAGTERMLSKMDAVFAPIVRQFKRIRLRPFISPSETRECLLNRLDAIGESEILAPDTYRDLHELVQGHPYEAQLIAHHAYRRYQENPRAGFSITLTVLNDVLAEVERFKADDRQRFAVTLRSYSHEELRQLASIVLFPGLTLHEKAMFDAALTAPGRVQERISARKEELKKYVKKFRQDKMITHDEQTGTYHLAGDQFDHLYAKLFARSQRIHWMLDDRPIVEISEELVCQQMLQDTDAREWPPFLIEEQSLARPHKPDGAFEESLKFSETRYHQVLWAIAQAIGNWQFRLNVRAAAEKKSGRPEHLWFPTLLADLGEIAAQWLPSESIPTARVRIARPKENIESFIWLQPSSTTVTRDDWEAALSNYIAGRRLGLEALGWNAEVEHVDTEKPLALEEVLEICKQNEYSSTMEYVLQFVSVSTIQRYMNGQHDVALEIGEKGLKILSGLARTGQLNNVGYIRMRMGMVDEAAELFEEAVEHCGPWSDLPRYNLAICRARMGSLQDALRDLRELEQLLVAERIKQERTTVVEIISEVQDSAHVVTEEIRDIELRDAIMKSLQVLSAATSK